MSDIDTILSRVQKLLALADKNSNVNEAAVATAKAQGLIEQYNLDQAQIAADKGQTEISSEEINNDFAPLYEGKRAISWKSSLAEALSRANNCRVFLVKGNIRIVGKKTGVELTRFLFEYVSGEVERLCDVAIKSERDESGKTGAKTWANNFKLGAVAAVRDTLKTAQAEARSKYEGTQAMAIINNESMAVDNWLADNMKLRNKTAHPVADDSEARVAGYKAGKTIDLSRTGLSTNKNSETSHRLIA